MSEVCRYCGDDPRQNCHAKEGQACEYPEYQRGALLAEIDRLRAMLTCEFQRSDLYIDQTSTEIERLQAMIHPFEKAMEKVEEQGKEIERLQALLEEKTTPGYELLAASIEKKDAEIARLKAALDVVQPW